MTTRKRITLRELAIVGSGVEPAVVEFKPGLNVIYGASNTGKTYVLEAIEWCLGRKETLKDVPEALGYSSAVLTLDTADAGSWTLRRPLVGGDIEIFSGRAVQGDVSSLGAARIADPKQDRSESLSISTTLLQWCGLDGKKIRKNDEGKTERLTFPSLRKLTIVDEERIITAGSPFSTAQFTDVTKFRSLMKLLLTGVDDSSIPQREEKKIAAVRTETRTEVIESLIEQAEADLRNLGVDIATLDEQIEAVDVSLAELGDAESRSEASVAELEKARQVAWLEAEDARSRQQQLSELLRRFKLLAEQYRTDTRRLDATIEAATALGGVTDVPCVLCGLTGGDPKHAHGGDTLAVVEACKREKAKLETLDLDLARTVASVELEREGHQSRAAAAAGKHQDLLREINEKLAPARSAARVKSANLIERRALLERASVLEEQLNRLRVQQQSIARGDGEERAKFKSHAPSHVLDALARDIESLLKAWHFPDAGRVSFNTETDDIIISGKERASFGKGYRAVTHAACIIGLMFFAREAKRPHTGLVVLDSPLNPYEGPADDGEGLTVDMKLQLLRSLTESLGEDQVLLLENDLPITGDLKASFTHFTRAKEGRYGFFPRRPTS